MPVTNMHYKSFSQIGVGDRVIHNKKEYQVMVRSDDYEQLKLCTEDTTLITSNWRGLEVLSSMNETLD